MSGNQQIRVADRFGIVSIILALSGSAWASDWPQYMRDAQHSGNAAEETLAMPLGLAAQVRLDDMILSSPAVVGDQAFVVDQMATAYCIDWRKGQLVWKSAPEGDRALGSNTSSACVAKGRVYYGTTGGNLHILDAQTGKPVKSIALGWSIIASPVCANDSIYIQSVGAIVHCLDLEGKERWRWDHYQEPVKAAPDPHHLGINRPYYGGGEVAVSGNRLVTSIGWDLICLEDKGASAARVWGRRPQEGFMIPMAPSISGDYVYAANSMSTVCRYSLSDGKVENSTFPSSEFSTVLASPAVRGSTVYVGHTVLGFKGFDFSRKGVWETRQFPTCVPVVSSPALAKEHGIVTTFTGELIGVQLTPSAGTPAPLRFRAPKPISSSPAISSGHVFFGCDDGYLYVLGPGGTLAPKQELTPKAKANGGAKPGSTRDWPSPYGGPGNTNYVEDPSIKPPFKLRWAARAFGAFVQPLSAIDEDLIAVTLEGTVVCQKQQTGQIRWRRRLEPNDQQTTAGALCVEDRIYVARPAKKDAGVIYCLERASGEVLWSAPIGWTHWYARGAPVAGGGVVAFGSTKETGVVEAWDAKTGKPAWQVKMGAHCEPHGCEVDGILIYSGGAGEGKKGETVAIDPTTGQVLWRNTEADVGYRGTPAARDGKVYLCGWNQPAYCISAKDGKIIWKTASRPVWGHAPALTPEYFTGRGYGGYAARFRLADGAPDMVNGRSIPLGSGEHTCAPVLLTSGGYSLAISVAGLCVREIKTGEQLWLSQGFASRTCSNPIAAGGRVYCNPTVSGMVYCFEPSRTPEP